MKSAVDRGSTFKFTIKLEPLDHFPVCTVNLGRYENSDNLGEIY